MKKVKAALYWARKWEAMLPPDCAEVRVRRKWTELVQELGSPVGAARGEWLREQLLPPQG